MEMHELIERWRRAAERAEEEKVRILALGGEYRATSSSHPLGSYLLHGSSQGWACECIANAEYGMPCKHLWVLAEMLGLDVLTDIRISQDVVESSPVQPAA